MSPYRILNLLALALLLQAPGLRAGEVVVIAHPSVPHLDRLTVERIYTGKVVQVDGITVEPLDLPAGDALRARFLGRWVRQDEDRFAAYWTVRRYVGKGTPPREVRSGAEVQRLVAERPGYVGYVDEADLKPGANIVAR